MSTTTTNHETKLYQYSILSALVNNVYSNSIGTAMKNIQHHGDFGLGTFVNLNGELVMLDGIPYHLTYDGTIKVVEPDTLLTFAAVTKWKETSTRCWVLDKEEMSKDALQTMINSHLAQHTQNYFLAIKMTGSFKYLKVRTAKAVTSEQSFKDVPDTQRVEEIDAPGIVGTMVGFRAPGWSQGVTVAGYHLHFIDENKRRGGHVLNYALGPGVTVEIQVMKQFKLELPQHSDFGNADIKLNVEEIERAEED